MGNFSLNSAYPTHTKCAKAPLPCQILQCGTAHSLTSDFGVGPDLPLGRRKKGSLQTGSVWIKIWEKFGVSQIVNRFFYLHWSRKSRDLRKTTFWSSEIIGHSLATQEKASLTNSGIIHAVESQNALSVHSYTHTHTHTLYCVIVLKFLR